MSESLPKIAAKHSFKVAVEQGKKYFWCSCGLSQNQPFCDGAHKAHKNLDGTSIMKSLAYEATETKTVSFCGCKHSKNPPFCDGSHNSLI
jgi:CDGSH iron-sulfur domain-containing protein 3